MERRPGEDHVSRGHAIRGFQGVRRAKRTGYYDIRSTGLRVTASSLENSRYRVNIDTNGDIASVFDKEAKRELLESPIRLEMRDNPSPDKPAWRILYETVTAPVREYPTKPVIRIVERGPVRVALEITRHAGPSYDRPARHADGRRRSRRRSERHRLEVDEHAAQGGVSVRLIQSEGDLRPRSGHHQRGNNHADAYEVPGQWWADLTDTSGTFGRPCSTTASTAGTSRPTTCLRLTLLHSPKPGAWPRPFYQSAQDIGSHRFVYSLAGHAGDWRAGRIPERAARLNQKLVAFQTTKHAGVQGPSFSLAALTDTEGQIAVRALKRAEDSDEIVIRVQELYGRTARTRIKLSGGIGAAREINAAEEPIGPFAPSGSELDVSLGPYQPRTFAVRMALASGPVAPAVATSVPLALQPRRHLT
jgi:alpha-mannosidase